MDGKHIRIVRPLIFGAQFYNYKGFYSIVLMAIVNSSYEFTYVDVGKNGRISNGGVINSTLFYDLLNQGKLNLPENKYTVKNMNYVFIVEKAFSLNESILKPGLDLPNN